MTHHLVAFLIIWHFGATMPTTDEIGACDYPVQTPRFGTGTITFQVMSFDSTKGATLSAAADPGQHIVVQGDFEPGDYWLRCWASDAGGASCDTTMTFTVPDAPTTIFLEDQ